MQKNILYITQTHTHTAWRKLWPRQHRSGMKRMSDEAEQQESHCLVILLYQLCRHSDHHPSQQEVMWHLSLLQRDLWCLMFIHTNTLLTPPPPADSTPFQENLNTWVSLLFRMSPAVPPSGQRSEVTGRRGLWSWTHTKLSFVMEAHNIWRSLESGDPLLDPEGHEDRLWRPTTVVTLLQSLNTSLWLLFPLRSILIGCEGTGEVLLLSCRGWCWDEDVSKSSLLK